MRILGVNTGHDAGIALIVNGDFVEVINEERFSRYKGHHGIPTNCIEYIKRKYKIDTFDLVVTVSANGRYQTPLYGSLENEYLRNRKGEKLFGKAVSFQLKILPLWRSARYAVTKYSESHVARKIEVRLRELFPTEKVINLDHHLAHAWSALAFTPTPQKALIITMDGEGDGLCGSVNTYLNGSINRDMAIPAGVGIGTLYGKVTEFLGMKRNEHEYKLMGLAPYAKEQDGLKVLDYFKKIIWLNKNNCTFESSINVQYAKYQFTIDTLSNHRFDSIAWGIQRFTEELVLDFVQTVLEKNDSKDVYFSGGVFMNIKLNQILRSQIVDKNLFFTPSCGDESLSIGAAKYGYDQVAKHPSKPLTDLYLGTDYSDEDIFALLNEYNDTKYIITDYTRNTSTIEDAIAELLANNEVVARFKQRMEWGARALGNRSILANPADADAIKKINAAIKNRDFWMPFAPTILDFEAKRILTKPSPSPYMALGFDTDPDFITQLISCTHQYDGTCRPQILTQPTNPAYYALIKKFSEYSGIGVVLNTSFNLHGKPIVESPKDALETFVISGLRHLAIGNYLISKK